MRILILWIAAALINLHTHEVYLRKAVPVNQNGSPLFSFGLIADVQYCDCAPAGSRYYRSSLSKLKEALNTFKQDSVSFIINLGDLIDRDFESFSPVLEILKSSGLRVYHCTGNHDYAVKQELKEKIPVLQPSGSGYYAFNVNNFRMIVLNGNEISTYASNNKEVIAQATSYIKKLKEEGAVNTFDWNGGIGGKQLLWLEGQLKDSQVKREKVIVFCHFPIAPENIHNLLNYKEILPVIERNSNMVAWFSGHNHSGNYINLNGVHFITMKGMVETEADNNFATVEVYNNRLVIKGYGNEKSQIILLSN